MSKFLRTCTMKVQGRSGAIHTIKYPLTTVFDVNRRATGSLNEGRFMVYNLAKDVRNDIRYDYAMDHLAAGQISLSFQFNAGYHSDGYEPTIMAGNVQRAFSYRDGPDVVTEVQVLDGGNAALYAQVETSNSFPWDPRKQVGELVKLMAPHGVTLGAFGSVVTGIQSTRGVTWIGSVWDILKKLSRNSGGYAFIDLQKVYLLAENERIVFPGSIPQLDASTGLIGTPRRTGWYVDADMIFEPRLKLGQELKVASSVEKTINGTYTVRSIGHRGTISGAKDGGVVTSLNLMESVQSAQEVFPL